jgi:predicted Zn-dependent protease
MTDTLSSSFSQVPGELLELLAQIGYMGINNGFNAESQIIFDALVAVRPQSDDAWLLNGTAQLFLGKIKEGTKILIQLVQKNPANHLAKSFLALAFKMSKVDDPARTMAQEVLEKGDDLAAKELARAVSEFYDGKEIPSSISPGDLGAQQAQKISEATHHKPPKS